MISSVTFLSPGPGSSSSKLFRFAPPRIGDNKLPIVLEQQLLDFSFGGLIYKLLVEGDNSFSESLPDSIYLASVSSSTHSDSDVHTVDPFLAQQKNRLEYFYSQHFRLHQFQRHSIHSNHSFTVFDTSSCHAVLLSTECLNHLHLLCCNTHTIRYIIA